MSATGRTAPLRVGLISLSLCLLLLNASVTSNASAAPYPKLAKKLLVTSEMPLYWQSEGFQNAIGQSGCLARVLNPRGVQPTGEVSVLFTNPASLGSFSPEIGEVLATFRNSKEAFAKISSSLVACKQINGDLPNSTGVYGILRPLKFPPFGAASQAFDASITSGAPQGGEVGVGNTHLPAILTMHVVVIEKGKYVLELFYANSGSIDDRQFSRYISRALVRV